MPEGPTLACRRIPEFDGADLAAVRRSFVGSARCALVQPWAAAPEGDFSPASAAVGCRGDALLVLAEMTDRDVFTRADRHNQRMWELGDAFEMFLEADGAPDYYELHVAPNDLRLQLRIPIPRPSGRAPEELMVACALFESRVWAEPAGWTVLATVPFSSTGGRPVRFSFSRYDYTRGRPEPVLSTTSAHARLDFHRREEWGFLRCEQP